MFRLCGISKRNWVQRGFWLGISRKRKSAVEQKKQRPELKDLDGARRIGRDKLVRGTGEDSRSVRKANPERSRGDSGREWENEQRGKNTRAQKGKVQTRRRGKEREVASEEVKKSWIYLKRRKTCLSSKSLKKTGANEVHLDECRLGDHASISHEGAGLWKGVGNRKGQGVTQGKNPSQKERHQVLVGKECTRPSDLLLGRRKKRQVFDAEDSEGLREGSSEREGGV